jgi:hypothetical protein
MDFHLSDRATRMLERRLRNPKELRSQPEIESLLLSLGCPPTHPIIPFQTRFGGYSYAVRGDHVMELGIGSDPVIERRDGLWYCMIGEHSTAPLSLYMGETGTICAGSIPITSSALIFIEGDAVQDSLLDIEPTWQVAGIDLGKESLATFRARLKQLELVEVREASDAFGEWWLGQDCAVERYTPWYDDPAAHMWLYFSSRKGLSTFSRAVSDITRIREARPYPPHPELTG